MFIDNVSSYHEYSLDTRNDELRFLFTENITKYEGEISMCGFLFASEENVGIEMFKKQVNKLNILNITLVFNIIFIKI